MKEAEIIKKAKLTILPRDAAARKMTYRVPVALATKTIADAREIIQKDINKFDSINYVYIISRTGKLKGAISIKELFHHAPEIKLREAMTPSPIKAYPETDQEYIALLAVQNRIKGVPIVDHSQKFLGVVTNDTILSILDQESREDFLKLSGIVSDSGWITNKAGLLHSYFSRVPWIIVGLFGGLVTARVIGGFEEILAKHIILASFIPLVAYVANAVGAQTQTLYIRDLATKPKFSFRKYALKQGVISLLIGFSVWFTMMFVSAIVWGESNIGNIVGFSLFLSVMVATFFALVIPKALKQLGTDPANGSGPFATIIQDLLSVVIYLVVASLFI